MALLMPGLAGGAEMVLATRVTAAAKPWLTPAHRQWLQARGPLTVGISLPDHPPLEMIDGERFQGITADHLGLLFPAPVRFKTYGSRVAVLDALRRGEIDLACEGTELEAERADLALSVPYLPSQPVLVSLSHAPFDAERRGARLAMTPDQLLRSQVAAAYPLSELLTYETPRRALEALSLGEIDGFVGDTVTVHYLIQANYLLNLRVQGFAPIESRGFGMLVRHDDTQLKAYLDQALPAITLQHGDDILHSWSGSRRPLLGSDRVALTPSEKQWLDAHPRIPVVLNSSLGSLGKLNADRQAEGIGPDYLDLISHRAGLQFDYVTARNYTELEAILGSGKALLTPVYTSPPIASPDIKLLPPYLRSAVVVLARPEANAGTQRDKGIHHLQGLEGKRVAMVAGFFLEDTVRREHPRIRLQLYPDLAQALASVAADDSDAFVGNDYAARYANAQQLGNQLQLTGILEDYTRPVSLAVHAAEPELLSILEKAQLSISPEEMAEIVRLWAPRDSGSGTRFWREHRQRLLLLLAALALATATSLVWGFYLSRQMRRTRRAERRAEAANRAKSLFLSTTSHEIRTPLSAIIGLLELAQDREKLGLPHRDTLAAAHKASQGMLLLLGNVLDLHRIESGHIDSTPQPVALRPLIEDMAPLLQGLAHGKRLSLRTQVGKGVDHSVTADPLHLKQVLFNLLSNAIKFTERGSVTLRAQGTRRHDRLLLQMEVEDTGIGIAPQDQARLFKPFSQVPGAHQDQAFGSGLGLSITRRLLEHMGGTITLESVPGRGSRFTVRLSLPLVEPDDRPSAEEVLPRIMPAPLELRAKADTGTEPLPEVPAEPELRILAVEDYMFNRELLKSQLTALGQGISLAGDGQEAWARCLVESFDLIITDGRMPIMDGFEFIRRLRRREAENQLRRCRVIALTASPEASEALRYLQAGADEVLSKPASMEDLRRVIEQVRDELQGSAPGTWHRPPAAPSTLSPA
ncbi:two-component system sensor histidine kinase/response regulator [Delftia sp. GW456-R20]|uniref:ATP-binding protein n=1 Tax=Delftia sp. GW456-R20 TaxID=1827145 RepID=UPI0007AEBACD|nr:two-component system sensor histidine kinase/response regulator [Delftia sp. GW456-R20]